MALELSKAARKLGLVAQAMCLVFHSLVKTFNWAGDSVYIETTMLGSTKYMIPWSALRIAKGKDVVGRSTMMHTTVYILQTRVK